MTLPVHFPHVDWQGDGRWIAYEIFEGSRVPSPHTWQDWIAVIALIGAILVFLLAARRFDIWWQKDVLGIFGAYRTHYAPDEEPGRPGPVDADLRGNRASRDPSI